MHPYSLKSISIVLSFLFFFVSGCSQSSPFISPARAGQMSAPSASDPNIFVNLAKAALPSVVNISTTKAVKSPFIQGAPDDVYRRFFEDFFGPGWGTPQFHGQIPRRDPRSISLGTGFIIDPSGLILTNNHVVAGADEIKINFSESPDEHPTDGKVVGRDAELDIALIQVKTDREPVPLTFGDSDALQVGEYVMAVGNPFGQGHSVSHGIISAKERSVPGLGNGLANYLQTDAPINPGNSGGPLLNLRGEVIGINNAILANAQGIGFAIPISVVQKVLPQLRKNGSVERGYIGILIGELSPQLAYQLGAPNDLRAPMVTSLSASGPAERAGVKPYDIILSVNGKTVHSASELVALVSGVTVGDQAKLKLLRDGKELTLPVTVEKRPEKVASHSFEKSFFKRKGKIALGMELETLTPELARRNGINQPVKGVVVTSVDPEGPANRAGLSPGDIILEVERKEVPDTDRFYELVKDKKVLHG